MSLTNPKPAFRTFVRANWIILAAAVTGAICVAALAFSLFGRLQPDDVAIAAGAGPSQLSPQRVYLVCGNDDGAPNDLTGCSVGLDGSFASFGNSVRPLTQPLLSPDSASLAFAEPNGRIVVRAADGTAMLDMELPGLSGPLDWSSDGSSLLVSDRSAVVIIDLKESAESQDPVLRRIELPAGHEVLGIARFSPDGASIAVGTKQDDLAADEIYRILVLDPERGAVETFGEQVVERDPTTFTGTFADPAFDSTGERLAWADGISGDLSVLDRTTGAVQTLRLAEPPHLITGVSWSPTGLIAVGVNARLRLVDPADGMAVRSPLPPDWAITASAPAWSKDGTQFVTTVQTPETEALLDLVLVDLSEGSVRLLTNSSVPPAPISTFPGFPVWPSE